jgi:DNA-binding beta-propeller fold protein YncE
MIRLVLTHCLLAALLVPTVRAAGQPEDFDATTETVGWRTDGFESPANQLITPAGTLVELPGIRPNALALSPDGELLVTSGLTHELLALSPATGKITQRVALPGEDATAGPKSVSSQILHASSKDKLSLTGLVFSPDGGRIYLANVNGDIKVFAVGPDHRVSPLSSFPLPPAAKPGRMQDVPTGLAVSRDGKKLYVALNVANQVAELDAATGKVMRIWTLGVAPYGVALAGGKMYVSNWGGRRPDADSVVGPIGMNGVVRVDARSIASEGSVSVIDLASGKIQAEILTGLHACATAVSPNGRYLAVANAGSDTISILDTARDKIIETLCARQNPGDPFGAQPDALAFDKRGRTLFACNGTQNAVAVFQFRPGESKLLGLVPVGWFPAAIAFDARRQALYVANLKSVPREKEEAHKGKGAGDGFNTHQRCGSLSLVPVPSPRALPTLTRTALANLRYPLLAAAKLPARADRPALPVPERVGEPSVFQHVIYVIKENRTYDQVLGDIAAGNGNADLCVFGERITPNQHKLVRDFVLLDNTYCCSILSADGHQWADSALATEYLERSFAGWPRSYPGGGGEPEGRDALAYSPAGFIWDDALKHGRTVCDFGECTTDHHYWKDSHLPVTKWLDAYRDFVSGSNAIVYTCEPDIAALGPCIVSNYVGFDLEVPDVFRAAQFIKDFKQFEQDNNLPNLAIVWLPNDHTSGAKFGSPTPAAQVADNDLALGQIVEAVSRSRYWTNTCLFVIEDDPQDGWDHVSGFRTTAYVVSAYTKRHAVIHTQYNHTSLLRTIELMLGLPPMNQLDATATPMFDCFTNTPDFTAYTAQTNQVPLDEMNFHPKLIRDAALRKDAYVSAKLPLDKEDQCPEDVFNRILWRAMKGPRIPYPVWAVTARDDD